MITDNITHYDLEENQKDEQVLEDEFQSYFDKDDFPIRLGIALRYSGKQRKTLCDEAKITEAAISNYIKGKQKPNRNTVERLAQVCGVTYAWLAGARHANIEFNTYRIENEPKYSEGFRFRNHKVLLILMRHLHISPTDYDLYEKLLAMVFSLNGNGIQRLTEYAQDLKDNPRYHNLHRRNYRYSIDSDFSRSKEEQEKQYRKLIELNDLVRTVKEDDTSELHTDSSYRNTRETLDKQIRMSQNRVKRMVE